MSILDGIYSQFSEKDVAFANIELKQFDVDLKGERRELSNVQALDAWFETEDAQDAQEKRTSRQKWTPYPSRINRLLGTVSSTIKGSDPKTLTWLGNGLGKAKA